VRLCAEVGAAKTMIERTEERFGFKPERPPETVLSIICSKLCLRALLLDH
jgi:hypothetical protein